MALKGQMADMELRNQQIQASKAMQAEHEAETAQKNRDLADQSALQDLEKDPENFRKIYAGDFSPVAGKIQSKTLQSLQSGINDIIAKKATATTAQLTQESTAHKSIGQTLDSFRSMKLPDGSLDLARINESFGAAKAALAPELKILGVDPTQLPGSINSENDLLSFAAKSGAAAAITDAALGRREAEGKARKEEIAGDQAARVLAGTNEQGLNAQQQADQAKADLTLAETARHNQAGEKETALTHTETARHDRAMEAHAAESGATGTWAIQEDASGKPVLFNSKTAETKPITGVQKSGTQAKKDAAQEKAEGPARDAVKYADDYLNRGDYTGAGDEALQEKFFELAKPSTGFRMTKAQMDMLQHSRGLMGSVMGKLRHATSGTWFDNDQRKEIVKTMKELAEAKSKGLSGVGTVKMISPDGAHTADVSPDQVDHYLKLGAKKVE